MSSPPSIFVHTWRSGNETAQSIKAPEFDYFSFSLLLMSFFPFRSAFFSYCRFVSLKSATFLNLYLFFPITLLPFLPTSWTHVLPKVLQFTYFYYMTTSKNSLLSKSVVHVKPAVIITL